jgi:hypothetical protein
MKRLIAAVSLAVLAAPVYAAETSAPFEQTQFDRGLVNSQEQGGYAAGGSTASSNAWAQDHNFIAPAK